MLHIAIDTSGIGLNRKSSDENYEALQRLVQNNQITVHIPYIVQKEIESQEKDYYLENFNQLKKALRRFSNVNKTQNLSTEINNFKTKMDSLEQDFINDSEKFSKVWIEGLNSKIIPLSLEQSISAWDSYFNGTPPLTSKKNRLDIPDSFICKAIEVISTNLDSLIVLAQDKKIVNTFTNNPKFKVIQSIKDLISSPEIQMMLKDLDKGILIFKNKTQNLLDFIQSSESENPQIHLFLESKVGEALLDLSVYDIPFSNDADGEATISSYYDGRDITLDLVDPIHYGDDQLGFKFELNIEVMVNYCIDKNEYYMQYYGDENSELNHISVQECNDHVLDAESTIDLKVNGIVSVKIKQEQLDFVELANCDPEELDDYLHDLYVLSEFNVVSIDEIEVI